MNIRRRKDFEELCLLSQEQVIEYVKNKLVSMKRGVTVGNGYVYSEGSIPILLCAHMDTVHKEKTKRFLYSTDGAIIMSQQGVGGDDRCGIYMIMKIIKHLDCHVAFFEDEEIGGVGSRKFSETDLCKNLKVNYVIELDRMNDNDAVFYDCDNKEFEEFITEEFWETAYGSFTDISTICPVIGVAGVNLSCGYYKQHTTSEYVILPEMDRAITETMKLIQRSDPNKKFEYIEKKYGKYDWKKYYPNYYGYGGTYGKGRYSGYGFYDDDEDDDWFGYGKGEKKTDTKNNVVSYSTPWKITFKKENGELWEITYYASKKQYAIAQFEMDYPYDIMIDCQIDTKLLTYKGK